MKTNKNIRWIYQEQCNVMAIADCTGGGLPLITICDDFGYPGINPYYSYPFEHLVKYYGFIDLGEF